MAFKNGGKQCQCKRNSWVECKDKNVPENVKELKKIVVKVNNILCFQCNEE